MACYHIDVKVISRGSGRSSVAAAAYRSRDKIYDERQGMTFDYTKKKDLAYAEIMLPKNSPEKWKERSILWNEVEKTEKRKDAQLAREVELSLPTELNLNQQIALVRDYAQKQFVDQGMIADVCIHKSEKNPHVHIMLTMREVTPKGFGHKQRSWNDKNHLLAWREEWAVVQNRHLLQAGYDIQVDHRSYEARGINLEPKLTLGPGIYRYLPKGYLHLEDTRGLDRLEEYQRVCRENGERITNDPDKALKHIGHYDAVFKREDILDFAFRHSADKEQFNRVLHALEQSQELVKIGKSETGDDLYTTRTMLTDEKFMLEATRKMKDSHEHAVEKSIMDQTAANYTMSAEQDKAFRGLLEQGDIAVMIGRAGTGKSYTLGAVREAYEAQGYKIRGLALSGIAAEGLQNESGIPSTTIYKQLDDWDHGREKLRPKEVLVIDEAGMVGTRQMHQVLGYAREAGAKVIMVGDNEQLQSIEAGGSFRGIIQQTGYVELAEIRRQHIDWQKQATVEFSGKQEQAEKALDMYQVHGHIKEHDSRQDAKDQMLADWAHDNQHHQGTSLMMAYTNRDVADLNKGAREHRKTQGQLKGPEHTFMTERGERDFSSGDRIIFLRNEHSMGVRNGSLGTVEQVRRGALMVKLDKGDRVAIDATMYKDFDHGYAATVHKTQGSTIDHTYVLGSRHFDKHTAYVAMSRHRENTTMYYGKDDFKEFEELKQVMGRQRPKALAVEYAEPRGIEADDRLVLAPAQARTHEAMKSPADDRVMKKEEELHDKYLERYRRVDEKLHVKAQEEFIKAQEQKGKLVEFYKAEGKAVEGLYRGRVIFDGREYGRILTRDGECYIPYQKDFEKFENQLDPVRFDVMKMDKAPIQQDLAKTLEKEISRNKGWELER
jgi:Ti-type conjugative transfer relaxase TraA